MLPTRTLNQSPVILYQTATTAALCSLYPLQLTLRCNTLRVTGQALTPVRRSSRKGTPQQAPISDLLQATNYSYACNAAFQPHHHGHGQKAELVTASDGTAAAALAAAGGDGGDFSFPQLGGDTMRGRAVMGRHKASS